LLVLLVGCNGGASQTGPTGPTAPVAANAMPSGPPLVAPGEHMSYELALQGVKIATYDLAAAAALDTVDGKQVVVVQGHAKAAGLATLVSDIDDTFTSWIDVTTGRSLRFQTDEYATKSKDREHTVIEIGKRSGDQVPIEFHLNDGPPTAEPQKASLPETWDYNEFVIGLRSWEGAPGSSVDLEIFRSRWLWHVSAKIHGKEKLVTPLGDLPALRFDAHASKLTRAGGKDSDDERDFSVWISDDADRVPLQVVARTDYGDVKMKIVAYDPGSSPKLRQ
jgi:hypothetical protein